MKMPGFLLQHTVQVEEYLGASSKGDLYGPVTSVPCLLEQRIQMVINPGGEEVTSGASYIARLDHKPPPKSRVTLPGGRASTVITVAATDGGRLPIPNSTRVYLQ